VVLAAIKSTEAWHFCFMCHWQSLSAVRALFDFN